MLAQLRQRKADAQTQRDANTWHWIIIGAGILVIVILLTR